MTQIVVNGRFLSRAPTGVDRVAEEICRALDQLIGEGASGAAGLKVLILTPPDVGRSLGLSHIDETVVGGRSGHLWEQLDLPRAVGDRFLLNLCNTGPLGVHSALVLIHDAQVYQSPRSYSRAFRWSYRVLLPLLARRAQLVATVSAFSRRELERYGVVPRGKAVVLANGCDHVDRLSADGSALKRFGLDTGGYWLALGSLSAHKNLATLLLADALRERAPDMPLVIAGGSDPRVFSDGGLPRGRNARFVGRVSDEELKALYANAAALLFPSFFEGFGLPPLEAMRCGCPVLASTAEAVRETCGDAVLYADPSDPGEWARNMDRLVTEPGLREDLSRRGRTRADAFVWRETALQLIGLVRSARPA